jgi:hypothetical protein
MKFCDGEETNAEILMLIHVLSTSEMPVFLLSCWLPFIFRGSVISLCQFLFISRVLFIPFSLAPGCVLSAACLFLLNLNCFASASSFISSASHPLLHWFHGDNPFESGGCSHSTNMQAPGSLFLWLGGSSGYYVSCLQLEGLTEGLLAPKEQLSPFVSLPYPIIKCISGFFTK